MNMGMVTKSRYLSAAAATVVLLTTFGAYAGAQRGTADHLSDVQQHVGRGRIGEPPLRDLVLFDLRPDTREPWHFY